MNVVRRLFAALLLLGVVIGGPAALWVFGRDLLPDHLPSWAEVQAFFTQRDSGALFLGALVLIGIAAWLVFTISVLVELAALLAGHRGQWHIPGLRIPQRAAGTLIAILFTTTMTVGTVMPAAAAPASLAAAVQQYQYAAVPAAAPPARPASANNAPTTAATTTTTSPTTRTGPTWTVGRYDTLWRIADRTLGDGSRFPEIVELNQGVVLADGRVLHDADTALQTGWVLRLPADATLPANPAAPAVSPDTAPQTTPPRARSGDVRVTVAPGDTLSGIVQQVLGDESVYSAVAAVNHIADPNLIDVGDTITIPASLTVGQQLPVPAGARTVQVQPGDTLSEIALREWGDADLYPALAKANQIADPSTIAAGSTIVIPAPPSHTDTAAPAKPTAAAPQPFNGTGNHAAGPATTPAATAGPTTPQPTRPVGQAPSAPNTLAAPPPPPTSAAPHTRAPATHSSAQTVATAQAISEQAPTGATTAPVVPTPQAARGPVGAAPTAASTGPSTMSATPSAGSNSDLSTTIGVGMGAVLAGAVWTGLLATRRRRGLRRPLGQIPVAVSSPAARMERRLRERAGTVDVGWMDRALRCAASLSAGRPTNELPDVTCVWLSTDELQLQLATAVPAPAPFLAEEDSWILPTGTELPDVLGWTDPAAPFPTLASLGGQEGETLLVDLERLGAVTIAGDPQRTTELLNHLAVEFAHNLWSDHLEVTLVGWGEQLVALNPDRIRYVPAVAGVTAALKGRISDAVQSQQELHTTVLASRISDRTDDDIWTPQVLLIDATACGDLTELQNILQLIAGSGRSAVTVLARGGDLSAAGGAVITIDSNGMLALPAVLGDNLQIQAASTSQADLDRLLELFVATDQFERPGPAKDGQPWAADMDVVGDLVVAERPADVEEDVTDVDPAEELDDTTDVGQKPDAQVVPIRSPAAEAARVALAAALAADPDLDEDLAEWNSDVVRRPKIGVLGSPLVISNGVAPSARLARFTEMVVYLALHREVSGDKFATDLWDEKSQPSPETRRSDVSRCRSWLGIDEEGRKYLPDARNKPYRLVRLLDLELFKRLRKRAAAKLGVGDHAGAATDLASALKLVRGPVLAEASKDAYAWLTENDPASVGQAAFTVLGAAHQLVELAIAAGDLDLAHTAADAGYEVGPREDLPMRDKARIAHRAGDEAAARGWVLEILRNNGVEIPEDLENHETFVVVNEIFPQGLRGA